MVIIAPLVYSKKCQRPNICFGAGYCCDSCRLGKECETKGGDITSSFISKIPYELHMIDTSGKKYSYCGY